MIMFIAIIIVFNENVLRSKCVIKYEDKDDFLAELMEYGLKTRKGP